MHYRIDTLPYEVRQQAIDKVKQCFTLNISKQPTLFKKLYTLLKMLQEQKFKLQQKKEVFKLMVLLLNQIIR